MNRRENIKDVFWPITPIINYRNCLVEKVAGGFLVLGHLATSEKEVDDIINNSLLALQQSIDKDFSHTEQSF